MKGVTDESEVKGATKGTQTEIAKTRYVYSKGKSRTELHLINQKLNRSIDVLSTFDGMNYQVYDKGMDRLTFSKTAVFPRGQFEPNPLLLPFVFVYGASGVPVNLNSIKTEKLWQEAAKNAVVVQVKESNEADNVMLQVPGSVPNSHFEVTFSKTLNYYPVKIALIPPIATELVAVEISVEEPIQRVTQTGVVTLPQVVKMSTRTKSWASHTRYEINPMSLKINDFEPDGEEFTIPVTVAKRLYDMDADVSSRSPGNNGTRYDARPGNSANRRIILVAILSILGAVTLAMLLYSSIRSRKIAK